MISVSITGATGFIGSRLVNKLEGRDDVSVTTLVCDDLPTDPKPGKTAIIRGNLMDRSSLKGFLIPGCTVINCAYDPNVSGDDNLHALRNLADECVRIGIRRFIHCSTAVVAGRTGQARIDETTECRPANVYETTKFTMEKILVNEYSDKYEVIILRPTAVFGQGGQNLLKLAKAITEGNRLVNYIRSCFYNYRRMNLVCLENVIAAFEFLIKYEMPGTKAEIFIISDDDEELNVYRKLELCLMEQFGKRDYPVPVFPVPLFFLASILKLAGRINYNLHTSYSCEKLLSTGFEKTYDLRSAISNFVAWYNLRINR